MTETRASPLGNYTTIDDGRIRVTSTRLLEGAWRRRWKPCQRRKRIGCAMRKDTSAAKRVATAAPAIASTFRRAPLVVLTEHILIHESNAGKRVVTRCVAISGDVAILQ